LPNLLSLLNGASVSMTYSFHTELSRIWQNAVALYGNGHTTAGPFPIDDEIPILQSCGISKIDVFDYAEDWCLHQEPDIMTFILVHYERWNYFTEVQKGKPSIKQLDPSTLPAKSEHAGGVAWLPRILPKTRAKLRGELPDEVMYGCGGDRQFFQLNNIHPAEFLRVVRNYDDDDQRIIDWVLTRKNSSSLSSSSI